MEQISGPQFPITEQLFFRPLLLSLIARATLNLSSKVVQGSRVTMASDETMVNPQEIEDVHSTAKRSIDIESVKRKKFKTDDLPLSAAQHAVIDKLLHSFKKKGGFDSVRKQIWADFNDGV